MSFWPKIYNKIASGEKIFEYRRAYSDESTMVYMYVSKPVKKIIGVLYLGERIDLNTWKESYSQDSEVSERITEYQEKYRYAMPVLSFQEVEEISLETLRENVPNFVAPQSYIYVDKNIELKQFLDANIKLLNKKNFNNFDDKLPAHVCMRY